MNKVFWGLDLLCLVCRTLWCHYHYYVPNLPIWSFKAICVLSYIDAHMYKTLAFYNPKQKRFQCMKRGQYNISKRQKSCLDGEIFLAWVTTLCEVARDQPAFCCHWLMSHFFSNPFFYLELLCSNFKTKRIFLVVVVVTLNAFLLFQLTSA